MCITSGEYAYEKIMSDKILIGVVATTTYNDDGQSTKRNKQVTRERLSAFFTRIYYDVCETFPTAGDKGDDKTSFRR